MPKPNHNESKDKYMPRCMAHSEMNSKFPDQKQRAAVCQSYWEQSMNKFERPLLETNLVKVDVEEKRVFGIFSLTKKNGEFLIDKQDDVIDTKDLEEAAYEFVLKARIAGMNHEKKGVGRLIESMVFTKEKMSFLQKSLEKAGINNPQIAIDAEFWWGAFQVDDDDVWNMIKSGDLMSFSIGGKTNRYKLG